MKNWDRGKIQNAVLIAICVVLAGFVLFYNILGGNGRTGSGESNKQGQTAEVTPEPELLWHEEHEGITFTEVCRLLSFLAYTRTEQSELPITEALTGRTETLPPAYMVWLNAAMTAGYITNALPEPEQQLTCGAFRNILVAVCRAEELDYAALIHQLPERLMTVREEDMLYLGEFLTVYELIREQVEGNKLQTKQIYVFELEENQLLYDHLGTRYSYSTCQDYSQVFLKLQSLQPMEDEISRTLSGREDKIRREMTDYRDTTLELLCSGNDILYIRSCSSEAVTIPNAWVFSAQDSQVSAYISGYYKEYPTILPLQGGCGETVCDIVIQNGVIRELTVKQDVIQGKVLMTGSDRIEVEGYGRLELSENFRIYKLYGEMAMEKTSRILVGYTITDFVVADGKICAALITEKLKADNIRVLISTNGYASRYHTSIELTADRDFTVTRGKNSKTYAAGETVRFLAEEEYEKADRVIVETVGGEGKIQLTNLKRSSGIPAYRGTIELTASKEGLIVVNELSLEEYLYAVIPSEMPTSYGDEALKVQAVCARSYAYNQLVASRFREYGAHVDDSVSCQVYNNIAENEASILAVKETYGLVAASEGSIITAYYYSSSCGHTASYEEVWEAASPVSYLSGCLQNEKQQQVDFSKEEIFRDFLLHNSYETYEQDISWYRWQVTIPAEQLLEQSGASKVMDALNRVKVTKRGSSGIAMELTLYGTKNGAAVEYVISYQTAIRTALAPKKNPVTRQDGNSVEDMSLLPSAFLIIDEVEKESESENEKSAITAVTVYGGGYGHGTGMSQNGVKCQVDAGKSFEDIISYYYQGTELIFLY